KKPLLVRAVTMPATVATAWPTFGERWAAPWMSWMRTGGGVGVGEGEGDGEAEGDGDGEGREEATRAGHEGLLSRSRSWCWVGAFLVASGGGHGASYQPGRKGRSTDG